MHYNKNGKYYITYNKYSFSIFKQEMSREERSLLREVLSTLGQFGGLDNFQWLLSANCRYNKPFNSSDIIG
jgi:hypothetical protein